MNHELLLKIQKRSRRNYTYQYGLAQHICLSVAGRPGHKFVPESAQKN